MDAELRRLYRRHAHRFGDWVFLQAQLGPWKLARAVAERERAGGAPADLEAVEHIFWWDGDLRFLTSLQPDAARFSRALDLVGSASLAALGITIVARVGNAAL